jgi:hypothetical protein
MSIRRICDKCGLPAAGEITVNSVWYKPDSYEPHGIHLDLCQRHFDVFIRVPVEDFLKETHMGVGK